MAATNYTVLIARVRTLAHDTATSRFKGADIPVGVRDGVNTRFRLHFPNPVANNIFLTYGTAQVRVNTGFTILDGPSGYITMTAAPDAGITQPFFFDYYSQWFLDADYQTMIDEATDELGGVAGTDLPEGLYPAQVQGALAHFWNRWGSAFAREHATVSGGVGGQPQTITPNYIKLADAARKASQDLLMRYSTRFGGREIPASGTITYGIDPGTPYR